MCLAFSLWKKVNIIFKCSCVVFFILGTNSSTKTMYAIHKFLFFFLNNFLVISNLNFYLFISSLLIQYLSSTLFFFCFLFFKQTHNFEIMRNINTANPANIVLLIFFLSVVTTCWIFPIPRYIALCYIFLQPVVGINCYEDLVFCIGTDNSLFLCLCWLQLLLINLFFFLLYIYIKQSSGYFSVCVFCWVFLLA